MRNIHESANKQFVLAKFEPGNILLVNRYTKQAFNYFQVRGSVSLFQQLNHPHLQRPLFYGNGLLYPQGDSNMQVQLENRRRAYDRDLFSEQELLNTFLPLFQCVEYLHSHNVIHKHIHPENVIILDGQIKLRDWLIEIQDNVYYSEQNKQNRSRFDDFEAIGQLLAQYATLKKSSDPFQEKDVPSAIESIIDVYSKNLIFVLIVLLKHKNQLFDSILPLMENKENNLLENAELNNLYNKIKADKANRLIKNFSIDKAISFMPTPKKIDNILMQSSPSKKFNITHTAKKALPKSEDAENKKVFNQEVKKRQIQKITKIIERSNAFVNELMARKSNVEFGVLKNNSELNGVKNFGDNANQQHLLKKIPIKGNANFAVTMNNISMYSVEPTKKSKDGPVGSLFSPNKRLRTISRKK